MWDSEELHQRRFVVVLSLGMFCLLSISVQAKYSGGSGTAEEDPYQIATAADLMLLGESPEDYDKHFILTADIDLDPNLPGRKVFDGTVIAPETYDTGDWRFEGSPFTGVFDGNGHTIRNLVIEGDNYIGLFGSLGSGSCIRSLAIKNAEITAAGSYVGILAGQNEYGSISHCCSTGFVSGRSSVGGLVGKNGTGRSTQSSIISHCYSTSSVKAASWVGGLVGHNVREIVSSFSVGRLLPSVGRVWPGSGSQFVGGLVGNGSSFKAVGSFWDVEASGQITSSGGMGLRTSEMMDPYWYALNGWAGDPNWVLDSGRDYPRFAWEATAGEPIPSANIDWLDGSGTALDPYRLVNADQLFQIGRASILWNAHFVLCAELDLGHVTCSTAVIPRFEGVFDGRHWDMRNLTIRGRNTLGLFGVLGDGAIVRNVSIVDAKVTNERDCTGILAGYNRGDVMNCHSSGMVTSDGNWTGGLVGTNLGRISSCFSTGNVQGATYPVGGLVGSNYGRINRCFSTGNVPGGTYYVGGLVGQNHGRITECYSTGYVSGKSKVGGLVGIQEGGSVAHSFWDIETSRRATSAGGIGKTTAEMQDPNTFMAAGWDFAGKPDAPTYIWVEPVGTGYPILWWQSSILPELPAFSGGTGEPAAPYLITTADELSSIGYNPRLMEAHFKLMLDVDLWGLPFYPIGNEVHPYVGVFDGNSHTISNLSYDSNGVDCVGLFGYVSREGAQVRDLGLIEAKIQIGTGANIGALVGRLMDGTISGCYSQDSDVLGSGS